MQICALVQVKPRTVGEIVLALKATKAMGGALVGRLVAAGVIARDGDTVSVVDAPRAKAIAAGKVEKLPVAKRKKRKPKTNGEQAIPAGDDATVCFGKDEDGYLTIARRDGEGSTLSIQPAELPRLMAYVRAHFPK